MPLKLISPLDNRKETPYWYVRGMVRGRLYEVSTKETNRNDAERFKAALENKLYNGIACSDGPMTFKDAALKYLEYRGLSRRDESLTLNVVSVIGGLYLDNINQDTLVRAAMEIMPNGMASSKNRSVMRPAAAVLHYAAENKWCGYIKVRLFKEKRPMTKAISPKDAQILLKCFEGDKWKKLLLLWLFKHGDRISDVLEIDSKDIDLRRKSYSIYVNKTDEYRDCPLDDEVAKEISSIKKSGGLPIGRLFTWGDRHNVYRWLNPVCKKLGIKFTPHMARHSTAVWLRESGAGQKDIQDRLGHADIKSSARYQTGNIETVRLASRKLPKLIDSK